MTSEPDYANICAAQTRSPFHLDLSGFDIIRGEGVVQVRFELSHEAEDARTELTLTVESGEAGLDDMVKRGYDALIEALQQLLWEAATQREGYRQSRSDKP